MAQNNAQLQLAVQTGVTRGVGRGTGTAQARLALSSLGEMLGPRVQSVYDAVELLDGAVGIGVALVPTGLVEDQQVTGTLIQDAVQLVVKNHLTQPTHTRSRAAERE